MYSLVHVCLLCIIMIESAINVCYLKDAGSVTYCASVLYTAFKYNLKRYY